jgi:hypothetical protein
MASQGNQAAMLLMRQLKELNKNVDSGFSAGLMDESNAVRTRRRAPTRAVERAPGPPSRRRAGLQSSQPPNRAALPVEKPCRRARAPARCRAGAARAQSVHAVRSEVLWSDNFHTLPFAPPRLLHQFEWQVILSGPPDTV